MIDGVIVCWGRVCARFFPTPAAAAWTVRAQAQTTAQNRKARRTSFDSASSVRDAWAECRHESPLLQLHHIKLQRLRILGNGANRLLVETFGRFRADLDGDFDFGIFNELQMRDELKNVSPRAL